MTVAQLRKLVNALDGSYDSAPVLRPAGDHSYIKVIVAAGTAEFDGREYFEYFDDNNMNDESEAVKALIIE